MEVQEELSHYSVSTLASHMTFKFWLYLLCDGQVSQNVDKSSCNNYRLNQCIPFGHLLDFDVG